MTVDEEQHWREEFERIGPSEVRKYLSLWNPETKQQLAHLWLREQEKNKEDREADVLAWTKLGVTVAIIAAVAAIIGAVAAVIAAWPTS